MWEACGALGLPVAIHISDPEAFFLPIDRFNERYEELHAHPDWSFHGKDFPPNRRAHRGARPRARAAPEDDLHRTARRAQRREPGGRFGAALDRYPNFNVEIGARIGELGRQPRTSTQVLRQVPGPRSFSAPTRCPTDGETPQQIFGDELYRIYFRFLETEDEYFDYAPAPVPPQGRWRIYGVGLPDAVLKKVYNDNARRLLHL